VIPAVCAQVTETAGFLINLLEAPAGVAWRAVSTGYPQAGARLNWITFSRFTAQDQLHHQIVRQGFQARLQHVQRQRQRHRQYRFGME
jgi:type IV secretory pathway VirD2 relaxase